MARINKEEYQLLKELENRDFKWLAKDRDKTLIASQSRPSKTDEMWRDERTRLCFNYKDSQLFQFIQWEDEEPHNIQELIEEYEVGKIILAMAEEGIALEFECESEEAEVKKDIKWLKREIHKELETWHGVEGGIDGDGINKIMSLINQLDEPETVEQTALLLENVLKENKRLGKLLEEKHEEWLELMDEINNQEVLSDKWIYDNSVYASSDGVTEEYIHVDELQNLLVPKQELPVIPKFVAEVIEEHKELGYDVYDSIDLIIETNGEGLPSISDWVAINIDKYARAWLNGYMVEKEQKYYAVLKKVTPPKKEWLTNLSGSYFWAIDNRGLPIGEYLTAPVSLKDDASIYTLEDWNRHGINDTNADFVKVEELEE